MPDFTVERFGTDTSGRPILMTRYMQAWWERVCAELGFTPTIVQGAFMARVGGGAAASAGYHDLGGCIDLRVWDRTEDEVGRIIRTTRRLGAGSWVRDQRHGMDPHIHLVLGSDQPLASGAEVQWSQYLNGRDGLAGNGPDYQWRPEPLVTVPPQEDPMAQYEQLLKDIHAQSKRNGRLGFNRDQKILDAIGALAEAVESLADTAAKQGQVAKVRGDIARLRTELVAEEPDASPRP